MSDNCKLFIRSVSRIHEENFSLHRKTFTTSTGKKPINVKENKIHSKNSNNFMCAYKNFRIFI